MTTARSAVAPIAKRGHLLRVLGLGFGVAIGIGSVIGGGILRTPGLVVQDVPVVWLALLLWLFAGVHSLLTANIVAEVMTSVPKNGGLFNAAREAFGDFGALIVGWTDWLLCLAAVAALSLACAEFVALIYPAAAAHVTLVGIGLAGVLFLLNWFGVREGSVTQMITSTAKALLLLGLVVAVFALRPDSSEYQPPPLAQPALTFFGVVVAYQLITGAYAGWVNPSYFAEEDTQPSANIPKALFVSLAAVTTIYLLMNAALVYALPLDRLASSPLPAAVALQDIFGDAAVSVVATVAVVTIVGAINAQIMVGTRVLHGLGRDHFLPSILSRVNKGGTPDVALGVTAALTILLATTGEFATIFLIMGALGIFVLVLVDVAFFKLRFQEPNRPRPFRAWLFPWLPALALLLDVVVLLAFVLADLQSGLFMAAAIAACVPLAMWTRHRRQVRG